MTGNEGRQADFWELLGDTAAVVDATGRKLVRPGKAASFDAKSPARDDGSNKKWRSGSSPLDAKVPAGRIAGFDKPRMVLAPAKFGNRTILRRRD